MIICRIRNTLARCVSEGDVDVCDMYTFTGCDLYDEVDILHVCT